MIYPEFISKGGTIGICAPSAGVGRKIEDFDRSVLFLKQKGFQILETPSVRVNDPRSADALIRGRELNSLFENENVDIVMCAAGGDFLDEMIPCADFETMKTHPKWLYGMSDPTGLLFPYTCMCDVATIYGTNAGSYDIQPLLEYLLTQASFLENAEKRQTSFPFHTSDPFADKLMFTETTVLQSQSDEIHVRGRCIGGCMDVLKDLIGTRFDHTHDFLQKYQKDGTVWYFDNFCLSAESLYRTLLQFRYAGWFDTTHAILIGRTAIPSSETGMSYEEAVSLALHDIPYIQNADIGHVPPTWAMINGAMMNLDFQNKKAEISFQLI